MYGKVMKGICMSINVPESTAIKEVPQSEQTELKNISYKGNPNNTLERVPSNDSFGGKKSNTGKVVGIVGGLVAAVVLIVGGLCLHKGGKALGKEAKFGEKLKKGWEELWHKGRNVAGDGAESATAAIKPEYIGPKEFNPADYVSIDKIPGKRFGNSIKQYDAQGRCIRIIHPYHNVVEMVLEYKPGSEAEVLRILNYYEDGKTLKNLAEYSNGEWIKSTWYNKDGKTIKMIVDRVRGVKSKYEYKEDGVTIDKVLLYDKDAVSPNKIIQYENGKPVREILCDESGNPM